MLKSFDELGNGRPAGARRIDQVLNCHPGRLHCRSQRFLDLRLGERGSACRYMWLDSEAVNGLNLLCSGNRSLCFKLSFPDIASPGHTINDQVQMLMSSLPMYDARVLVPAKTHSVEEINGDQAPFFCAYHIAVAVWK